ncbi:MAG: hypothetical protein OEV59_00120 [Deltaproteobacteria bacterium]|nr:hypothetical protein [Deltaproteobacteria bacterium]
MVFVAVLLFVSVFVLQKESFGEDAQQDSSNDAKKALVKIAETDKKFTKELKSTESAAEVEKQLDAAIDEILNPENKLSQEQQKSAIKDLIAKAKNKKDELEQTFKFKFGMGILYTNYTGKRVVNSATEKNGVVSIDEGDNQNVGLMFETHNFIRRVPFCKNVFFGPFLGIKPDEGELIDAAMLGFMVGFKYKQYNDERSNQTFNIGVGYVVDPKEKVLANGYVEGRPLPAGATNVDTKLVTKTGWGMMVSYGF